KKIGDQQMEIDQLKQTKEKCEEKIEKLTEENEKLQKMINRKEVELIHAKQQISIIKSSKPESTNETNQTTKTEISISEPRVEPQKEIVVVYKTAPKSESKTQITQTPIVNIQ